MCKRRGGGGGIGERRKKRNVPFGKEANNYLGTYILRQSKKKRKKKNALQLPNNCDAVSGCGAYVRVDGASFPTSSLNNMHICACISFRRGGGDGEVS